MKANVFLMRCITNLHVGNGDVNYDVIDQEVERDPVTGLPIINSSGVKGALREFFETKWGKKDPKIMSIFGDDDKKTQGSYKFLQADILFRPLRVSDNSARSFVLATTEEIINVFNNKVKGLGRNPIDLEMTARQGESVEIEGEQWELKGLKNNTIRDFVRGEVAVVNNLNNYDLPVMARNVLDDNGTSKNLWYEEFVPHESVFALVVITPNDIDVDFKAALISEPVQFGGNASIGYGLMDIMEV